MTTAHRKSAEVAVVSMPGIVDLDAIGMLDHCVERAMDAGVRLAVFDLSQTRELAASAVLRVVEKRRWLRARGGDLAVVAAGEEMAALVRRKGGAELPVLASCVEAEAYVRSGGGAVLAGRSTRVRRAPRVP